MSLILRQQCQPVLNEYGLGDYHVRINDSKYLSVTGPCGKPMFSVSGIEFVRAQPTSKEIEFAVELLTDFCLTHKATIRTALIAKKALFNAVRPEVPSDLGWSATNDTIKFKVCDDVSMIFNVKTKEFEVTVPGYAYQSVTLKQFIKVMSVASMKKYTKVWNEQTAYAKIESVYNAEISALQTCNI